MGEFKHPPYGFPFSSRIWIRHYFLLLICFLVILIFLFFESFGRNREVCIDLDLKKKKIFFKEDEELKREKGFEKEEEDLKNKNKKKEALKKEEGDWIEKNGGGKRREREINEMEVCLEK